MFVLSPMTYLMLLFMHLIAKKFTLETIGIESMDRVSLIDSKDSFLFFWKVIKSTRLLNNENNAILCY